MNLAAASKNKALRYAASAVSLDGCYKRNKGNVMFEAWARLQAGCCPLFRRAIRLLLRRKWYLLLRLCLRAVATSRLQTWLLDYGLRCGGSFVLFSNPAWRLPASTSLASLAPVIACRPVSHFGTSSQKRRFYFCSSCSRKLQIRSKWS